MDRKASRSLEKFPFAIILLLGCSCAERTLVFMSFYIHDGFLFVVIEFSLRTFMFEATSVAYSCFDAKVMNCRRQIKRNIFADVNVQSKATNKINEAR